MILGKMIVIFKQLNNFYVEQGLNLFYEVFLKKKKIIDLFILKNRLFRNGMVKINEEFYLK